MVKWHIFSTWLRQTGFLRRMLINTSFVSVFIFFILLIAPSLTHAGNRLFRGPWNPLSLPQEENSFQTDPKGSASSSFIQSVFLHSLLFFQRTISSVDGNRCPMYPSCSQFGVESIHKHGVILGTIMTTARLTQERGEMKIAPKIMTKNGYKFYDPVEGNDFWFTIKKKDSHMRRFGNETLLRRIRR